MASVSEILSKVRALGADVVLERDKMTITGSVYLNGEQRQWLASHRAAIEAHLRRVPGATACDEQPKPWGEFARMLYAACPDNVDPFDWSWFVTTAGKIVRGELDAEAETLQ